MSGVFGIETIDVKVVSDQGFGLLGQRTKVGLIGIKTYEVIYEFALRFNKRGPGFRIVEDELSQKCKFFKLERKGKKN